MDDEQAQQQNQSSTSKDVARFIGKQGAKKILRKVGEKVAKRVAVQGLRVAATEGLAALAGATSELWVPVLVIGLIGITFFVVLFGGAPTAVGGDLSNNPSPTDFSNSSPGPSASINPNINPQLANDLVITGSGANQQAIADVQRIMSIPYQSSTYRNLLTSNGKYKVYIIISGSGGCGQNTTGGPGGIENAPINLLNWNCSYALRKKMLIHETGHVIAIRNGTLGFPFSNYSSPPNPDSSCYTRPNGYLRTYSYKATTFMGNGMVESFPEAISDNITPHPTDVKYGDEINNYPSTCANTYIWIKNNIFGGIDLLNQ